MVVESYSACGEEDIVHEEEGIQVSSMEVTTEGPKFKTFDTLFNLPKYVPSYMIENNNNYGVVIDEKHEGFDVFVREDNLLQEFDLSLNLLGSFLKKFKVNFS